LLGERDQQQREKERENKKMEQEQRRRERERERERERNDLKRTKSTRKSKNLSRKKSCPQERRVKRPGPQKTDKNPKFHSIKYLFLTENNGHNREKKKFKFDPRIYTHTERGKSL